MSNRKYETELAKERRYVGSLYEKLDTEREETERKLNEGLRDVTATSPGARWERQAAVDHLSNRLTALRAAYNGLCFGRIDLVDGSREYVGRVGLFDEENDYAPLLLDWRAPAARPFYCATIVNPEGLRRRRHFHLAGREVRSFHDDVLDLAHAADAAGQDSALLAALNAPREEQMRDIVATIQTEQDAIIRLGHQGVVVIEGGPGTGKTAVALHRAAYLLYALRERMSRWGVLVVGPNYGFLGYIGNVLPSLGESDVVFATPGELAPGLRVTEEDAAEVKRVKGDLLMVDVLRAAIADRQELPGEPITIELSDVEIDLDDRVAGPARQRARESGLLHNDAREVFREQLTRALVQRAVDKIGEGWLTSRDEFLRDDLAEDVLVELRANPQLRDAIDLLWPYLTPQRLLAELYTSQDRIGAATGSLPEGDGALLHRADGFAWTVSDVPLLDEAVEWLGKDLTEVKRAEAKRREEVEYAKGVLQVLDTDQELDDGERLRAVDLLDAETLSERHTERDHRYLAERAAADREWTYGHVVVDEAQELSEMDWRVIMRRCPSRSMTIVGDLSQRENAAGARSWGDMLDRYVGGRWTYRRLTVNYRTPAEIMEVATTVLFAMSPLAEPPTSVRAGDKPMARQAAKGQLADAVAELVRGHSGKGSVAVIAHQDSGLSRDVVGARVLTPRGSKGLEFDNVIVVEPTDILADAEHGAAALYVALTRATQRLDVVHTEPLPELLSALAREDV